MHAVSMALTSANFYNPGLSKFFHPLLGMKIAFRLYEKKWETRLALVLSCKRTF